MDWTSVTECPSFEFLPFFTIDYFFPSHCNILLWMSCKISPPNMEWLCEYFTPWWHILDFRTPDSASGSNHRSLQNGTKKLVNDAHRKHFLVKFKNLHLKRLTFVFFDLITAKFGSILNRSSLSPESQEWVEENEYKSRVRFIHVVLSKQQERRMERMTMEKKGEDRFFSCIEQRRRRKVEWE